MKFGTSVAALAVALLACAGPLRAQEDPYRQGMEAFRAGDFAGALRSFQLAEAGGREDVTLFYNLGSTHYRLGNYAEARDYFQRIADDPKWGALAEYNLGLIEEALGNEASARARYRQALRKAESARVRELAQAKLEELAAETEATGEDESVIYLSAAAGSDDNPALVRDTQLPVFQESDSFIEGLGNASVYLSGDSEDGLRLNGGFYSRRYREASDFNVDALDLGLYLDDESASWRLVRGIRANASWIGGERYGSGLNLLLRATRRSGNLAWEIENDLGYLEASGDYAFADGWLNRFELSVAGSLPRSAWRIGYGNDYSDRRDLRTEAGEFFSYSYLEHEVFAQLRIDLAPRFSLRGRVEAARSEYADENVEFLNSGEPREETREEDRIEASLLGRFSLAGPYSLFGEYLFTDNDSSFERFAYRNHQFLLGIEAVF